MENIVIVAKNDCFGVACGATSVNQCASVPWFLTSHSLFQCITGV